MFHCLERGWRGTGFLASFGMRGYADAPCLCPSFVGSATEDYMSKLTLISFPTCPYVQRAVIALKEKGVPFEVIYIDLANKPDWLLAISWAGCRF